MTKTVQPFHILTSAMSTVRRSSDQSPTSANKDDLPTSHLLLRLRQHLKLNVVVRRSHLRRDSAWKAETSSVPIIGLISTFSAAKSRTNFIVSSHFRCVLDDSIGEDEKMRLSLCVPANCKLKAVRTAFGRVWLQEAPAPNGQRGLALTDNSDQRVILTAAAAAAAKPARTSTAGL